MQPSDGAAECAAALMPVLLKRLDAASERLRALKVAEGERSQALRRASRELERLGWLMGVVARGLGADLLGERRFSGGLGPLLELVRDALGTQGRSLDAPPGRLPRIGTNADGGLQACWAVAVLLWQSAVSQPRGSPPPPWSLVAQGDGHALRVGQRASPALAASCAALIESIPGARFEPHADAWTLVLPAGCLV